MRNDAGIAKMYLQRIQSAKARGISFELSLMSFMNLLKTKRCKYTGILLTEPERAGQGKKTTQLGTDRTLERIDNTKGYIKGNVIAVCHAANQLKNMACEGPGAIMNVGHFVKMAKNLEKRTKVYKK